MKKYLFILFWIVACFSYAQDSLKIEEFFYEIGLELKKDKVKPKVKIWNALNRKRISSSPYFRALGYNLLGEIHLEEARFDSSIYYLDSALFLREAFNYEAHAASTNELLARVYQELGEVETSLKFLNKSLSVKEKLGNEDFLKHLYYSLGNTYFLLDDNDSALFYYNKSKEIFISKHDTVGIANCYHALGQVMYFEDFNYEAIDAYKNAIKYYEDAGRNEKSGASLNGIGVVYEYLEVYDSALFYYNEAYENLKHNGHNRSLDKVFRSLAETYIELNKPDSAIKMFELYLDHRDSVFEQGKTNAILEYQTQYETKEAEQQAAFEKSEKEKVQAQNASNRKTIYVLLSVVALILGIVVYLVRNARQKSKLKALEIDSKNQEIDTLLKEQEAKSYAAMLEGQNTERERIAQDLHDRLGGTLAAVKVHFNLMDKKIEDLKSENRDLFNKVNAMLSDAVQDVRRISHDLASNRLSKLGLKGALEDLAQILNKAKKLEVDFFMDDSIPALDKKKEQEVYAILQELVNTLKHANATSVEMQLNKQEEMLNILYEDNGVGFEMKNAEKKGLGLAGLSNRVDRLEGTINFDSVVGRGTIVIINIPL